MTAGYAPRLSRVGARQSRASRQQTSQPPSKISLRTEVTRRLALPHSLPGPLKPVEPYTYQIMLLLLIPLAFSLDIHTQNQLQQDILGAGAWVILLICTRFSPPSERRQVWIMVAVATCVEIWGSIIWGIYRYRFHNLPMFVPPGHGLVYLFALRSVRTPLMQRYGRLVTRLALGAATGWAIFGLSLEPLLLGRLDVTGALFWPIFVRFMRGRSAPIFAAAFFITSILELWGTNLGNWAWQVYAPVSHIPTGNPPSVIAAGYCVMDFMSLRIAARLGEPGIIARWLRRVWLGAPPSKLIPEVVQVD